VSIFKYVYPQSNFIDLGRIITFAEYFMVGLNYISRIIYIGEVPMGGDFPIRIQSMTTTNTLDTQATVKQAIRMIESGCEFVRITAQGVKEAENLQVIKHNLKKQGFRVPLIADIHYNPKAAEVAARIVEKIRINPGNYTDRKKGKTSFSDIEYASEIEKIRKRIKPLISICNHYGTVIRIGSNHGSLSERILLKYGNTPAGMVESALEFVRICRDLDFDNIVLSMKASNVKIMIQANRLLVHRMMEEGMDYPIHLGVTEAGDAEDGRIKSAAGIGPLLMDGIGDTIRVSLTEDPEFEIPVAKAITSRFNNKDKRFKFNRIENATTDPFDFSRRITFPVDNIGNGQVPVVILNSEDSHPETLLFDKDLAPDHLFNKKGGCFQKFEIIDGKYVIESSNISFKYIDSFEVLKKLNFRLHDKTVLILKTNMVTVLPKIASIFFLVAEKGIKQPLILSRDYCDLDEDNLLIQSTIDFSYFLVDGLIDGIWINHNSMSLNKLSRLAFGILQATGSRITKTEYIACPSCGRTLFNIQETLQNIKSQAIHLRGLKIGVMGCCVNGPGEMADADYGYVGEGKGKITLYKRHHVVRRGIPENEAVESLIELIKHNGDWK
jgi:(E)-4-hydroxy-3-methylbut-2-enyl-diphosphate synthase